LQRLDRWRPALPRNGHRQIRTKSCTRVRVSR
jgi:hypothetical protein